jgi:hypothetical protein
VGGSEFNLEREGRGGEEGRQGGKKGRRKTLLEGKRLMTTGCRITYLVIQN